MQTLDVLLGRSLLELSIEGRYNQHPVLHSFCKEKLGELDDEITKCYEHYDLDQLKALRVMLRGTEQSKAFERLERDFANLRSTIEKQTEDLDADVAEPFRAFYTHKGRYTEGWELFSEGKGEDAQVCAAWFALMLVNLEKAEKIIDEISHEQNIQTKLIAKNTKAGILPQRNYIEDARNLSLATLKMAEDFSDLTMLVASMSNLAILEESLGNIQAATQYYQQVLKLTENTQNYAQHITTLNNLADLYLTNQNFELAKSLLEKALLMSQKSKITRMSALLQANFGLCLFAQGDYIHAEAAFGEAMQTALERGDEIEAVSAKIYLGQAIAAQGRITKVKETLPEALGTTQLLAYTPGTLSAVVRFAEIATLEHQPHAKEWAALVYAHPHRNR
ncbi:MAG: tetratricopeptide repeat protein [Trueperaceae bacterium]